MEKGETHRPFPATPTAARMQGPPSAQTRGALPLLRRAVGLPSLAAAQGDGVKVVEGAEGHPRDGDQG